MAIREVLVSFTFEQQRQMLNLIGADVGDASLLLTPTNVVVTAINEIITGDVDLSNQTIGMDDGTLASPSLFWDAGQGFYKVDANKLGLTTSLAVTGNLEVDGDITFRAGSGTGGTLTFGDLDTDNIVLNAELQSSIVPDSTANYNLGSLNKQWNNLWIDGTASIDTLEVDLDTTLTGNLAVNSGIIKVDPSTATTATIFNNYITTAQVLMDATDITIGANVGGSLAIRNNNITTSRTSINVFNTIATTVNAFGAASNVVTGLSTFGSTGVNSNFNIRSDDTVLDGDLNVNGGEILSSENTFDLLINNNDVRIGASNGVGETIINNSLKVTENVNLANSGTNITIKDNTTNSLAIKEGSNTYVQLQTTDGSERVIVYKDLYVVGNLDISGTSTVIDTTTLTVEDKNIELGTSGSPSDATADGGGITLKGTTDKTITYSNTNTAWESNIGFNVAGRLLVGTSTSVTSSSGVSPQFQVHSANGPAMFGRFANDATASALYLIKSRNTTTGGQIIVNNNDNIGRIAFEASDGAQLRRAAIIDAYVDGTPGTNDMPGRLVFSTTADGASSPTERMRLDSSGNVGINCDTPGSLLELNAAAGTVMGISLGTVSDAITASRYIGICNNADQTDLGANSGFSGIEFGGPSSTDTGYLAFHTHNVGVASGERMRIDDEGIIYHNSSNHGIGTFLTQSAGTVKYAFRAHHSTTAGSYGGTECFTVWSNGNVVNTNNSYGAISDIKLKENIVDASSQWNDLKAIQVRNYNFIEGQTHTQIGVVAQEVELVSPGLVTESPDRDEEDNDLGTVTKSVNYSVLYMKAVKALQEAMTRIETLEQRLSDAGIA